MQSLRAIQCCLCAPAGTRGEKGDRIFVMPIAVVVAAPAAVLAASPHFTGGKTFTLQGA